MEGSQVCQISSDGAIIDACYTSAGDKIATCSSTGAIQVGRDPAAATCVHLTR
jgi:hypothetical protein